jgi:hypothetical protein
MDVAEYLTGLQHSRKSDVERIRAAILGADPAMSETIKWNAPNYVFAAEDRVTFRLQPGDRVDLVLHRGARTRADANDFVFDDPSGLIQWATPDRGVISIPEGADLDELLGQILPVVWAWVRS